MFLLWQNFNKVPDIPNASSDSVEGLGGSSPTKDWLVLAFHWYRLLTIKWIDKLNKLLCGFIISLSAPVSNIKQLMYSDCLPEQ